MKLAMMSDIHANLQAFEACLEHAKSQGVGRYALLGDLVGYGADPAAVVTIAQDLHAQGAVVLKGNHDEMAVVGTVANGDVGSSTAAWTHDQLSAEQRAFLNDLPMVYSEGVALLVHASLQSPEKWLYIDNEVKAERCIELAKAQSARRVYVGHVHHQALYYPSVRGEIMQFHPTAGVAVPLQLHKAFVATIGSVGQPRDGDPRAMYAIVDLEAQKLSFQRVEYDHASAANAIRKAGLPEYFAQRLEKGR